MTRHSRFPGNKSSTPWPLLRRLLPRLHEAGANLDAVVLVQTDGEGEEERFSLMRTPQGGPGRTLVREGGMGGRRFRRDVKTAMMC